MCGGIFVLLRCNGRGARRGALARRRRGQSKGRGRRRETSYTRGRGGGGGGAGCAPRPPLLLPPPYTICWPGHRQLRGMVRPWTSTEVGTMQWPMLAVQLLAAGRRGGEGGSAGERGCSVHMVKAAEEGMQPCPAWRMHAASQQLPNSAEGPAGICAWHTQQLASRAGY